MEFRKLKTDLVVTIHNQGNPEEHTEIVVEGGHPTIGYLDPDIAEEACRRFNGYPDLVAAVSEIALIQENSNTWDPDEIGKALDNAVATAQGVVRKLGIKLSGAREVATASPERYFQGHDPVEKPYTVILQHDDIDQTAHHVTASSPKAARELAIRLELETWSEVEAGDERKFNAIVTEGHQTPYFD